jgi:hypothetical protein
MRSASLIVLPAAGFVGALSLPADGTNQVVVPKAPIAILPARKQEFKGKRVQLPGHQTGFFALRL